MKKSAPVACALLLGAAWSGAPSGAEIQPGRSDSLVAALKTEPVAARRDTLAKPVIDSADLKQLPPRVLPLKQQMMFAGGFMIFLAVMLTSMQNFNPND